jgi:hypothetical protein
MVGDYRDGALQRGLLSYTTLAGWCCCYVVVLLLRSAPAAAVGQPVPTELSEMTRQQAPVDGFWIEKSQCTTHSQCAAGKFCKWTWCGDTRASFATRLVQSQ